MYQRNRHPPDARPVASRQPQSAGGRKELLIKLYRYMSYRYWKETVRTGEFAAQFPSVFEDMFEGVGWFRDANGHNMILNSSAFDSWFNILCFNQVEGTDRKSEMQFWSRYADKGRGVRIIVDAPLVGLDGIHIGRNYIVEHVKYDDVILSRPIPEIGRISIDARDSSFLSGRNDTDFWRDIFFVKGSSWAWENEIRILTQNDSKYHGVTVRKIEDGKMRWFIKPEGMKIVGVDFGPCCMPKDIISDAEEIRTEMPEMKFKVYRRDVQFRQMCAIEYDQYKKCFPKMLMTSIS